MSDTNVIMFAIWTMNGEEFAGSAQTKIERAIERVIKEVEDKDGLRLLYTTTKA